MKEKANGTMVVLTGILGGVRDTRRDFASFICTLHAPGIQVATLKPCTRLLVINYSKTRSSLPSHAHQNNADIPTHGFTVC